MTEMRAVSAAKLLLSVLSLAFGIWGGVVWYIGNAVLTEMRAIHQWEATHGEREEAFRIDYAGRLSTIEAVEKTERDRIVALESRVDALTRPR